MRVSKACWVFLLVTTVGASALAQGKGAAPPDAKAAPAAGAKPDDKAAAKPGDKAAAKPGDKKADDKGTTTPPAGEKPLETTPGPSGETKTEKPTTGAPSTSASASGAVDGSTYVVRLRELETRVNE